MSLMNDGVRESIWRRYRQPAWVLSFVLFGVVFAGGALLVPDYTASTTLLVSQKDIQNEWDLLRDETRDVDFEEQTLSRVVLEPALRSLGLFPSLVTPEGFLWFKPKTDPDAAPVFAEDTTTLLKAVKKLRKRLQVERLHHSGILQVTGSAPTPQLAADIANEVADSFVNYRSSLVLKRQTDRLTGYEETMAQTRRDLEEQSAQYNAFLLENGWNDYQLELETTQSRVSALQEDLRKMKTVIDGGPEAVSLLPGLASDLSADSAQDSGQTSLNDLLGQVIRAHVRFDQARSRYLDGSPTVVQARLQKEALERVLIERLRERRQALERLLEGEQARLQRLITSSSQVQLWESAIQQAQQRYEELLAQRDQIRLLSAVLRQPTASFKEISVLDRALPSPSIPQRKRLVSAGIKAAAAGVLGLLFTPLLLNYWISRRGGKDPFQPAASPDLPRKLPALTQPLHGITRAAVAGMSAEAATPQGALGPSPKNGDPDRTGSGS